MPSRQRSGKNWGMIELRRLAVQILCDVFLKRAQASDLIESWRTKLSAERLALLASWVKGVLEHTGELDALISQQLTGKIESVSAPVLNTLRLGLYQLMYMEKIIAAGVVSESVEVAKIMAGKGKAGLVNAVLRKLTSHQGKQGGDPLQNLPAWIAERWRAQFGEEESALLAQALQARLPLGLSINLIRTSVEQMRSDLEKIAVTVSKGKVLPNFLSIEKLPQGMRILELPGFTEGRFYIQDESSAIVPALVDAKAGELIIDLCSAPGGKACCLAIAMRDRGRILAFDKSENRLRLVAENIKRLRLSSVEPRLGDALTVEDAPLADAVLVDAPCSGMGTLARKAEQRWLRAESDLQDLVALQAALLDKALGLIGPQGRLIYSTCSIDQAENEWQIEAFLRRHPGFELAALPAWLPSEFRSPCQRFYLSLPHRTGLAGAFAALLKARP